MTSLKIPLRFCHDKSHDHDDHDVLKTQSLSNITWNKAIVYIFVVVVVVVGGGDFWKVGWDKTKSKQDRSLCMYILFHNVSVFGIEPTHSVWERMIQCGYKQWSWHQGTNANFQKLWKYYIQITILTVKYWIKFNNAREARWQFYRVKFCSLRGPWTWKGHLIMKGPLIINGAQFSLEQVAGEKSRVLVFFTPRFRAPLNLGPKWPVRESGPAISWIRFLSPTSNF